MKKNKLLFPILGLILMIIGIQSCQRDETLIPKQKNDNFDEALNIGKAMLRSNLKEGGSNNIARTKKTSKYQNLELKDYSTKTTRKGKELYYIINYKPEGFAIVTASDRFKQRVLAFSDYGTFDLKNLNPALNEWVIGMDSLISVKLENSNNSVDLLANSSAQTLTTTIVGPLINTQYDQGVGFNEYVELYGFGDLTTNCTTVANGRPPAGCVPVAMAQLMNYWRPGNMYSWSLIDQENAAGNNGGKWTAQMISNLGSLVGTDYKCGGSGTSPSEAYQYFKTVRKAGATTTIFNSSIQYVSYSLNTVIANLNSNRPVYVDGFYSNNPTGHAWIIDGYRIDANGTYLSHNWGWRGVGNGFYLVGASSPHPTQFNTNNKIIANLFLN